MTTLELPEPELQEIRLDPYERIVRGAGKTETLESQTGRLALGLPILQPLNTETVDEDTRPFLQARPNSRFYLLTTTVSFRPDKDLPFKSAWVDITLRCPAPDATEQPVAWSMDPHSVADAISVSRKIALSPSLKVSAPGITLESAGPSMEEEITFDRHDVSLEALNEGTGHPRWDFYSTNSGQIRGVHTLCLVIDLPANKQGTASIEMGATIRMRHMKIFRFTAALPETPQIATVNINPA
jgi:hypothetical protein